LIQIFQHDGKLVHGKFTLHEKLRTVSIQVFPQVLDSPDIPRMEKLKIKSVGHTAPGIDVPSNMAVEKRQEIHD